MSDRFYLTEDDVRSQQRINKAVVEMIHPGPNVIRRRQLASASSSAAAAAGQIMFRCEYVTKDGSGNTGNYIHVFDQTYPGGHRAGACQFGEQGPLEHIPEKWIAIPQELEEKFYVFLVHYREGDNWHKADVIADAGDYLYYDRFTFEHYKIAKVNIRTENGKKSYEVEQLMQFTEPHQALFSFYNSLDTTDYILDLKEKFLIAYSTGQKIIVWSGTLQLNPQIGGGNIPSGMRYPVQNIPRNYELPTDSEGKTIGTAILFLADQNYQLRGEIVTNLTSLQYVQTNYTGRAMAAGTMLTTDGQTRFVNAIPRPAIDWTACPYYDYTDVDFSTTRERASQNGKLTIRDTASGIRISAGLIRNAGWSVPAGTLPLPSGVTSATVYLTCTWDQQNNVPVFSYTYDVSGIDGTTTWTKAIAYLTLSDEKWRITQVTDRDFSIYGRWI